MSFDVITYALCKGGSKSETKWETIFDTGGQKLPFVVEDGVGIFESEPEMRMFSKISAGDICKVVIDGVEYTAPAAIYPDGLLSIGDYDGTDETYPFAFQIMPQGGDSNLGFLTFVVENEETEHSFGLYRQVEAAPSGGGGGLTVVELGEIVETEKYKPSDSEIAALNAAAEIGMPIIVKFGFSDMENVCVFNCTKQGDVVTCFIGYIQGWEIIIMCMMGQWDVMVQGRT